MIIPLNYVGCDISKDSLDVHDRASGATRRMRNTKRQAALFAASLKGSQALVVMEATGAYDRILREALDRQGVAYARVNPTRARRFAQAAGFLAKTDAVDAKMLAMLGEALRVQPDAPLDPARRALALLQKRRDQLVQMRADEKKRLHTAGGAMAQSIGAHIAWLSREVAALDRSIAEAMNGETLKDDAKRLQSAPGVGRVAASVLIALLPELGRLSPKKIASLVGLAPVNNDSGALRGARRIKGGRRRVRQALYMAALAAARTDRRFAAFYEQILKRAHAKKIAIIAVARKLLVTLNAILRDKAYYA